MTPYVSLHINAALGAARRLLKQPISTLLIVLMLAVATTLPLMLYVGVKSSQTVIGKMSELPQITIYMQYNAGAEHIDEVSKQLEQDVRIQKSEFVSKQQGLKELQAGMGGRDLVSMLDENPLPDVFVVTPVAAVTPEEMQLLQKDLGSLPMVEVARLDTEWMQTLYQINRFIHQVLWFLACTLGTAFVLVMYNTIRLQILNYKEEIEITMLLGAPSSFIRRPLLYLAAWQSVSAVLISIMLCAWLADMLKPSVDHIFMPYGFNIGWWFFGLGEVLLILIAVTALGIVGALFATRQHFTEFKTKH